MEQNYPEAQGMPVASFMSGLRAQMLKNENVAYTENGAKMYGTTGKALLDLNFSVSSLRDASPEEIIDRFLAAASDDYSLALKWLFYIRDIREGMGERYITSVIFKYLAQNYYRTIQHLVQMLPVYGRWDDLLVFFETPLESDALRAIAVQWHTDIASMKNNQSCSLMAKWLPSINATSSESRRRALKIIRYLGISISSYRKLLSKLRRYLDVVEVKMTNNEWSDIDYSRVPSRANMLYSKAFLRHDMDRRSAYLASVVRGEAKVNSSTVYPHEIVYKITTQYFDADEANNLIAMWMNLPRPLEMFGKTLVVSDGSDSMKQNPSNNSGVRCLDVAYALAIYFSELLNGPFRDKIVTFSSNPRFIDLSQCKNIFEKVGMMRNYTEVANTNIELVFDMILETAIENEMSQEDLPDNILVLSDMEFDRCARDSYNDKVDANLFEETSKKFEEAGYKMPRFCFWNIASRTGAIPVVTNELGVALMSGFSINNVKLIMSGKLDPYEALVEVLNGSRYSLIYPKLD